jgi:hypothetical protein
VVSIAGKSGRARKATTLWPASRRSRGPLPHGLRPGCCASPVMGTKRTGRSDSRL